PTGIYTLSLHDALPIYVPADAVLVFSMVGYTTKEEAVGTRNMIDVILEPTTSDLEEVVVVGYGTQRRETITGSVVSVKSAELMKDRKSTRLNSSHVKIS